MIYGILKLYRLCDTLEERCHHASLIMAQASPPKRITPYNSTGSVAVCMRFTSSFRHPSTEPKTPPGGSVVANADTAPSVPHLRGWSLAVLPAA